MKTCVTTILAALVLATASGCANNAKPSAMQGAPQAQAGAGTVVVYVAGRDGLPGRVAMASDAELGRGEARDLQFLRANKFVALPAQGKQRLLVPYAGSSIDLDVKEGERVFVRLSFQRDHFVFSRVDEREAQVDMASCTDAGSL